MKTYSKKIRIYTQNIDSLEEKAGMIHNDTKKTDLIYLHGHLKHLICIFCGYKIDFSEEEIKKYEKGYDVECIKCFAENEKRKKNKLRTSKIGYLHTNIIHYDQPHHDGVRIAKLYESDMDLDLFIVVGTSLKVYGVKDLVKRGLRNCINNNGISIWINFEEPTKEFRDLFNYFWKGDCDSFFTEIKNNVHLFDLTNKLDVLKMKKNIKTQNKNDEIKALKSNINDNETQSKKFNKDKLKSIDQKCLESQKHGKEKENGLNSTIKKMDDINKENKDIIRKEVSEETKPCNNTENNVENVEDITEEKIICKSTKLTVKKSTKQRKGKKKNTSIQEFVNVVINDKK